MCGQVCVVMCGRLGVFGDVCVAMCGRSSPVQPPFVVRWQHSVGASVLEAADQSLHAADRSSDELRAAERLQAAAVLHVVALNDVIDAHGGVAVRHIESTAC